MELSDEKSTLVLASTLPHHVDQVFPVIITNVLSELQTAHLIGRARLIEVVGLGIGIAVGVE